ncbi:hypothetical protein ABZX62_00265 [Streptomyces flavidovirens]|uniref:hypothetical protein n=1 Tax=Streptomyces flavidovirens TaxID=67298 RepID=UPI0033A61243
MRVRMKVTLSGTRDGEAWPQAGGCTDLPDDEANHLLKIGLAEQADEEPTPEAPPEDLDPAAPSAEPGVGEPPEENAAAPADEETAAPASKPAARKAPVKK